MHLAVFVNEADMSDAVRAESLEINQNITDRVSQASLEFVVASVLNPAIYDTATYDASVYGVDVRELYEIRIEDRSTGEKKFAGTVRQVKPERKKAGLVFIAVDCLGWTTILDEAFIVQATFTGQTDQSIIQALVTAYAPSLTALTENIAVIATLPSWEIREKTLRQALDEIVEFSGGEWTVDWDKNLLYFLPTEYRAPFGLSDHPNSKWSSGGLTWNDITGSWDDIEGTWDDIIQGGGGAKRRKKGISRLSSDITWDDIEGTWDEITGDWDDPLGLALKSYAIDAFTGYSRDAIRIINRCTVLGAVGPGGQRIKAVYEDPISQGNYGVQETTIVDDQITVAYNASLRAQAVVNDNAFPRETITLKTLIDGLEVGQSLPIYHSEFFINGAYVIREMRIRQITREHTEYQITAGAREPDAMRLLRQLDARTRRFTGPVYAVPAEGTVTNASINGVLNAGVIGSVNAGSIIGAINSGQIGSVNAGVIAGLLTAGQIGSINAAIIQGAIISSQVADNLIDRLSMFAAPLRDIPNLDSDPTLPDVNFPVGSFYRRVSDNQFRKNVAGFWVSVTETEAITGKTSFYSIGTIKAGQIIGLIAAAQIGSINASSITGGILATQIATVNATAIQGTISGSQIGTINASSIVGTLSATQIGSINAATITIGLIQDGQIGTLNGAKIVAGTVDSSKMNTDELRVGGGSGHPGKINVVDGASILVAQIGTLTTGQYGGWFRVLAAAGNDYNSAKFRTDTSGNLIINDANFTVTASGGASLVETAPSIFDATYSSISLNVRDTSGNKTQVVSRGIVISAGSTKVASLDRHPLNPSAGELVLYNGASNTILADGATGILNVSSGINIIGVDTGKSETFAVALPAGGSTTLRFRGGVYIGRT